MEQVGFRWTCSCLRRHSSGGEGLAFQQILKRVLLLWWVSQICFKNFWKECVKAQQKMGRWVVRAAPAGVSPLSAPGSLRGFHILQLPRQLEVGFTAPSCSWWEDGMEETPAVYRFTATRTGWWGRSVCDLGYVKGRRRPVLLPSWFREEEWGAGREMDSFSPKPGNMVSAKPWLSHLQP